MRWTLCPKCHRSAKIVDMSDERTDQSMRTSLFFADSSEVCPRPGVVTDFCTKRQDNRLQRLTHVHLTDQVSLYNHQICRPRLKTPPSPEGPGEC